MSDKTKAELQAELEQMKAELAAAKARENTPDPEQAAELEQLRAELEASKAAQADLGKMVSELLAPDLVPDPATAPDQVVESGFGRVWSHFAGHRVNLPDLDQVVQFKPFFPGGGGRSVMVIVDGRGQKMKTAYLEPGTRVFRGYYDIQNEAQAQAFRKLMSPSVNGVANRYFNVALAPAPAMVSK